MDPVIRYNDHSQEDGSDVQANSGVNNVNGEIDSHSQSRDSPSEVTIQTGSAHSNFRDSPSEFTIQTGSAHTFRDSPSEVTTQTGSAHTFRDSPSEVTTQTGSAHILTRRDATSDAVVVATATTQTGSVSAHDFPSTGGVEVVPQLVTSAESLASSLTRRDPLSAVMRTSTPSSGVFSEVPQNTRAVATTSSSIPASSPHMRFESPSLSFSEEEHRNHATTRLTSPAVSSPLFQSGRQIPWGNDVFLQTTPRPQMMASLSSLHVKKFLEERLEYYTNHPVRGENLVKGIGLEIRQWIIKHGLPDARRAGLHMNYNPSSFPEAIRWSLEGRSNTFPIPAIHPSVERLKDNLLVVSKSGSVELSAMDVLIALELIMNEERESKVITLNLEDLCKTIRLDLDNPNKGERWRLFVSQLESGIDKHEFGAIWVEDVKKLATLIIQHSLHSAMGSQFQSSIDRKALIDKQDFLTRLQKINNSMEAANSAPQKSDGGGSSRKRSYSPRPSDDAFDAGRGTSRKREKLVCFKCRGDHVLQRCPDLTVAELNLTRLELLQKYPNPKANRGENVRSESGVHSRQGSFRSRDNKQPYRSYIVRRISTEETDNLEENGIESLIQLTSKGVEKQGHVLTILDNGAEANVITSGALRQIGFPIPDVGDGTAIAGNHLVFLEFPDGRKVQVASVHSPRFLLANRVTLRDLEFQVLDNIKPFVLLGRPVLEELGIDPVQHLNVLLGQKETLIMSEEKMENDDNWDFMFIKHKDKFSAMEALQRRTLKSIAESKESLTSFCEQMSKLIVEFGDLCRVGIDDTPPIKASPYVPVLFNDATPFKARVRKFNELQSEFLRKTISHLELLGLVYRNPESKWSSAIHLPPKGDSFRFCVDLKQVNKRIIPRAWPMPALDVDLNRAVSEGGYYAVIDNDNGYFQIENHAKTAEMFSFLAEDGVYTPTRLVQGCVDGVAVYQATMMEVLGKDALKFSTLWIDDVNCF